MNANAPSITSLEDAAAVLADLRAVAHSIERNTFRAASRIAKLEGARDRSNAPLEARREVLESALARFADSQRARLFVRRRSLKLPGGKIGFRLGRPRIETEADTLELLEVHPDGAGAIQVKKSVLKTALAAWPDPQLAEVHARRVSEEKFFYEFS